jgi:hypothetical protein
MMKKIQKCKIKECDRNSRSCGYCGMHYSRVRRYGRENIIKHAPYKGELCEIPKCNVIAEANGFCNRHNVQMRRHENIIYTFADEYRTESNGKCLKMWIK